MSNPRRVTPNTDMALLTPAACGIGAPGGVVESLGGTVDQLRQLAVDMGMRPYRVFSVIVRWTGGEVGRGDAVVESEREFLPRPVVKDMTSVRGVAHAAGRNERGSVELSEVSPRYTEDDIRGLCHCGKLSQDREGFIEIRVDERDGQTDRRRFVVKDVPHRNAEGFEWRVRLLKQDQDRARNGTVRNDVTPALTRYRGR